MSDTQPVRENVLSLGKHFAHRLSAMIEAHYLTWRVYVPWADALIVRLDKPPFWITELSLHKYFGDATTALWKYARSEPFEELSSDDWTNEYVASLFLRFDRRELSWASFLNLSGQMADAHESGHWECEEFYALLNEFEESDFALSIESRQREQVLAVYADVIDSVRRTYNTIKAGGTSE